MKGWNCRSRAYFLSSLYLVAFYLIVATSILCFFAKKDNVIKLLLALLPNCLTGFAPELQFRIFVFMSPLTCSLYICATDVYTVHVCVKLV